LPEATGIDFTWNLCLPFPLACARREFISSSELCQALCPHRPSLGIRLAWTSLSLAGKSLSLLLGPCSCCLPWQREPAAAVTFFDSSLSLFLFLMLYRVSPGFLRWRTSC
jgi:hypothetical protein